MEASMANIKVQGFGATGTDGDDLILGSQDADNIRGLFGDDQIHGGRGNDVLTGDYGGGEHAPSLVGGDDRRTGGRAMTS